VNNELWLGSEGGGGGPTPPPSGYNIERSVRFNSADSAYLSRTPASAGNRKTWTWAGWVKRSTFGSFQTLFGGGPTLSDTTYAQFGFDTANRFVILAYSFYWRITTQVFRDPSAWFHIVVAFDTTQATAGNRIKLYINGSQVTVFSTTSDPSLNQDLGININAEHRIGNHAASSPYYFNGYLADIHFIDGQALDPTSFGEFDSNGVWQPKAYTGSYDNLLKISSSSITTSGTPWNSAREWDDLFTDTLSDAVYAASGATYTVTFSPALPVSSEVKITKYSAQGIVNSTFVLNGSVTRTAANFVNHVDTISSATLGGTLSSITIQTLSGTDAAGVVELTVDGKPVRLDTINGNGFHLPFSDNSTAAALGTDTSGNGNTWTVNNISAITGGPTSVASATGALPILNTTDTYGTVLGSGVRSDSNASSLSFAVAGGTSSGLNITDQIPSGRTQAAQAITNNGVTGTTSTSKFYGGSANCTSGQDLQVSANSSLALGSTFTVEAWVNPSSSSTEAALITYGINQADGYVLFAGSGGLRFRSNGTLDLLYTGSVSGWNHVAFVANSSGTKRAIYLNGLLVASDNGTTPAVTGSYVTHIGSPSSVGSSFRFTGQFQDVRIYKGFAKYTSNFNPPSSAQVPAIAAGNDSLVDVPTNYGTDTGVGGEVRGNYCTLNPLITVTGTLSNGNLDFSSGAQYRSAFSTFAVTTGKWYIEGTVTNFSADAIIGIASGALPTGSYLGSTSTSWSYAGAFGVKWNGASYTAYGSAFTTNDVIGIAFDADTGKLWFSKNGVWQSSGDPASGANPAFTVSIGASYFFGVSGGSAGSWSCNFGQRPFAYAAPSGFKALNTANLPTPTIADGSTAMDVVTYTGNGSTQTISGLSMSPDLVWLKSRNSAVVHMLYDSVRGAGIGKSLQSNTTNGEGTALDDATNGYLSSLNSDGFSLNAGSSPYYANVNGTTYAAWTWDAGSSTVTNTDGSITSQVRANPSAGFSVVTFTAASNTSFTVGHGLGVAPQMTIIKSRNNVGGWFVWHIGLGNNTTDYLQLNGTSAKSTQSSMWGSVGRNSTVCGFASQVSTFNNDPTVMYCFAPVEGYSAFGSYVGNSADGPFVFCNFCPRWVMIKASSASGGHWMLFDTERSGFNVADDQLYANLANAEATANSAVDFLSNGFKPRADTFSNINGSGITYIYAAFAEHPFQSARAR
jgi:hypothetical protein